MTSPMISSNESRRLSSNVTGTWCSNSARQQDQTIPLSLNFCHFTFTSTPYLTLERILRHTEKVIPRSKLTFGMGPSQGASATAESTAIEDQRFAELLKPIKDLTQNWEVSFNRISFSWKSPLHGFYSASNQFPFSIFDVLEISMFYAVCCVSFWLHF